MKKVLPSIYTKTNIPYLQNVKGSADKFHSNWRFKGVYAQTIIECYVCECTILITFEI